jgi:hypothetical protein
MTLTVHYSRISLIGSSLVGIVIALPTLLLYKVETIKAGAVFFFFLAATLATRLILWIWNRSVKENSDYVRRRYKAGRPPVGR